MATIFEFDMSSEGIERELGHKRERITIIFHLSDLSAVHYHEEEQALHQLLKHFFDTHDFTEDDDE